MRETNAFFNTSLLIGRLCISVIFILSGIMKFVGWDNYVQYMSAKHMTMVPFFLTVAALIEIFGGLAILLGFKTRLTAAILLLYLIPVTGIFHNFWDAADEATKQQQLIEFLKNLTIWGALWYVLGTGAGRFSLDAYHHSHNNPKVNHKAEEK
jgi:putative oxidoreductase